MWMCVPSTCCPSAPGSEVSILPSESLCRRLNPAFVAWLQGLPWFWTNPELTNCGHLEMASYLSVQQKRLESLLKGSA